MWVTSQATWSSPVTAQSISTARPQLDRQAPDRLSRLPPIPSGVPLTSSDVNPQRESEPLSANEENTGLVGQSPPGAGMLETSDATASAVANDPVAVPGP